VLTETGRQRLDELGSFRFSRQVNAKLRHHLEPVTLPKQWRYVGRIPVNDRGKTAVKSIEDLLEKPLAAMKTAPEIEAVRRTGDSLDIDLSIPGDLLYFQGHFPGFPVLPGIAQLDWAVREARRRFDKSGFVLNIQNLKFRELIRPGEKITLSLRSFADGGWVSFEYRRDQSIYSSGRLTFAAE